jgi:betaine-homocysteine S-methyltransferase
LICEFSDESSHTKIHTIIWQIRIVDYYCSVVYIQGETINKAACDIVKGVATEGDALVAGGVSQTPAFLSGKSKAEIQQEFRKQVNVFVANKMDFLIAEYFEHVEEMEIAIGVCKESKLPVMATMCIGPKGDMHGVSAGDCAVRMAKAGADVGKLLLRFLL